YKEGKDATIYIDGQKVTSKTNEFDEQISGISLVVNQLSEKETHENGNTGYKTYSVDITTDTAAAEQKMQQIVDQYNSLLSALDELSARDTYTDGKNNYDGGDLAGDSQVISIRNALQSMVVRFSDTDSGKSIFDCGLEFNKDGTLSINSSDFKDAMNNSFNSVVSLFTSEDGLLKQMSDYLEDYTQTGGILDDRKDQYQDEIDSWTQKANDNETKLEAYEAQLRTKYGNLDSLMASYNTSMSYISSILSST
ncbi:MAG TPA: flagellar hook-associated protein 2, partial [Succinivibrio sp.]|nr:flagellar hook-associated protein 2 [Succinivibrio sp.]